MPTPRETWAGFVESLASLARRIGGVHSTHVSTNGVRQLTRDLVTSYFTVVRPEWILLGCPEAQLQPIDAELQRLLELSSGSNRKSSYLETLASIKRQMPSLEIALLRQMGAGIGPQTLVLGSLEQSILATLRDLLPSAAASYEQGLRDISDGNRVSYRGSATELREAMREVLDHLAPDDKVKATPGFKLEQGQTGPTQRQKMRYILKARELPDSSIKTSVDALEAAQNSVASFARSVYQRASLSTHTVTTRQEVRQLRQYIDAVLCELLEIHKA